MFLSALSKWALGRNGENKHPGTLLEVIHGNKQKKKKYWSASQLTSPHCTCGYRILC